MTYRQPSRPIPYDEHPRVGMVIVGLPARMTQMENPIHKLNIIIQDENETLKPLQGYRGKDGRWHFKSEPLIPGVSHIYRARVELVRIHKRVEMTNGYPAESYERIKVQDLGELFLRLIPGRIVGLRF